MAKRRRRNPTTLDNVTKLAELAAIGVGVYIVWQVYQSVTNAGGNLVNSAINAGNNFDANIGVQPFDDWVSSLFQPPQ